MVSEKTRNAWVSRERPLCLRGRLSQEGAAATHSTATPPHVAVATGVQLGGMGESAPEMKTGKLHHTAQEKLEHVTRRRGEETEDKAPTSTTYQPQQNPSVASQPKIAASAGPHAGGTSMYGASKRTSGKRMVALIVKDVLGGRADLELQVAPNLSVGELKGKLCMEYQDSPAPARQRIVCHGRCIRDQETVGSLLGCQQGTGAAPLMPAAGANAQGLDAPIELYVTVHPRG